EAGGDRAGYLAFDRLLHHGRLVLAERQDDDLLGAQDGADAHRDRLLGHVLLAEKAVGRVPAGHRVERRQAGATGPRRAGFVEADVPGPADAEDLQVDPPGLADELLVAGAVVIDLLGRHRPRGDVDVAGRNVDVV